MCYLGKFKFIPKKKIKKKKIFAPVSYLIYYLLIIIANLHSVVEWVQAYTWEVLGSIPFWIGGFPALVNGYSGLELYLLVLTFK